ncbi:MAG: hypothetical protein GY861_29225 [bacterium]|nr:hypothetical protein [bacterium]
MKTYFLQYIKGGGNCIWETTEDCSKEKLIFASWDSTYLEKGWIRFSMEDLIEDLPEYTINVLTKDEVFLYLI